MSKTKGILAALIALAIGGGWHVMTRLGVTTSLHPVDLALLRYGFPALVLAPVLFTTGLLPSGVHRGWLAVVVIGSGLPFGLLAMGGSVFAPVAHMGVIIPGGTALAVALLAWLLAGERYSRLRLTGLALVALSIGLLGSTNLGDITTRVLIGDGMFLGAAVLWALYTVAFRKCGLTPVQATALISGWSLLLAGPLWLATSGTRLFTAPVWDVGVQFLWQSVLAGVVAVWAYGTAVRSIGPANTAAIGALLPVASSIGGLLVLGEAVSIVTGLAIILTVSGVLLATGYLQGTRPPPAPKAAS